MYNLLGNFKKEKVSNYNVIIENKDGFVFYNQISGSLLLLDKNQFEQYRKLLKNNFFIDSSLLKAFRENNFIVSEDFNEVNYMKRAYEEKKYKSYHKQLTIVPTDKCNLGCFYCYEEKSQWKNMSQEVIEQTKKFVETFLKSSPTNSLGVTWFGGEPTLNLSCIEELNSHIRTICDKNKIEYSQYMVTNGTNINDKVIERLLAIGVKDFQITVDGYKEDHDESRPFLTDLSIEEMSDTQIEQRRKIEPNFGKFLNIIDQPPVQKKKRSTYDQIINNLQLMHKNGFSVSLRCNIGSHNIKNHYKLLNHLEELGLTKKSEKGGMVTPYVSQIFDNELNENLRDLTREEFSNFEMETKIKFCGNTSATANLTHFNGDSCTANKQYSFCISQSGKLTKCWHHVSNEKYVIGDVFDLNLAKVGSCDEYSPFDDKECVSCHVLPTCMGGCKEGNSFYEEDYNAQKYHGCGTVRWNIRARVNALYESYKNGDIDNNNGILKVDNN
jgi:uncharacterized protein